MKRILICLAILIMATTVLAADYRCEIVTGKVTVSGRTRPALWNEHSMIQSEDVSPTYGLTDPNVTVVAATITEAVLNSILADPDYTVLWYEEIVEVLP